MNSSGFTRKNENLCHSTVVSEPTGWSCYCCCCSCCFILLSCPIPVNEQLLLLKDWTAIYPGKFTNPVSLQFITTGRQGLWFATMRNKIISIRLDWMNFLAQMLWRQFQANTIQRQLSTIDCPLWYSLLYSFICENRQLLRFNLTPPVIVMHNPFLNTNKKGNNVGVSYHTWWLPASEVDPGGWY